MSTGTALSAASAGTRLSPSSYIPARRATPDTKTVADAYTYLLGRAFVIRQELIDFSEKGATYNVIKYNPLASAEFVNPDLDVAYLEAWIAVDDNAGVLLEVPEITRRYYTAQILDEWGEVIVNINERTFPSKPFGKFFLVKPGSTLEAPANTPRIELHSCKAKMLARVELKDDHDGAVKLQRQFKLTPLGEITVKSPPAILKFDNKSLIGVEIFDEFEQMFSSALDVSPNAAEMQQQVRAVAAYAGSSKELRMTIDKLLHEKIIPGFQEYAMTKSAPYRNHWVGGAAVGNYGRDFWLRTSVNFAGNWANSIDEATYFIATRDANDQVLNGGENYVIHFLTNQLPSTVVNSYWSVVLVGIPDYRVVPNSLNRFNFNSYSPLQRERDGSLKISIGANPVQGIAESNWLPSPAGKPFSLTFRTYVPKDIVKRGEWAPPAVTLLT
jgi:hypothetical protein